MGRKMAKKVKMLPVHKGIHRDTGGRLFSGSSKERLEKEAAHRGMKVVGTYSDEGKSEKKHERPEFRIIIKYFISKKIKGIKKNWATY